MTHAVSLEISDRLLNLGIRIHDERTIRDDGLVYRLTIQNEQLRVGLCLNANAITVSSKDDHLRFTRRLFVVQPHGSAEHHDGGAVSARELQFDIGAGLSF